ncbi:phage tail tube protein [Bradyrhizobium tropiciagri]|uniref:phage tail tube protein n=1 Tax=Bradyrhizobium tropiciagri TaxID=312253 RepID=UPI001BAB5BC9|nr:phage tail tube protein [Bradyrhizobium tropiciagri]MBR0871201.1 phage tail tube protein [Bradyrhizobium tropiciagri]
MHTSGGRVSTVIGGVAYSARGEITLDPSNIESEAGVNQDGSLYRTVKPKARTAEITFDRFVDVNGTPLRWDENLMLLTNIGITFIEQDTGVTHLLSGGFFTGKPKLNTATGEVSDLGLAADTYKTLTA